MSRGPWRVGSRWWRSMPPSWPCTNVTTDHPVRPLFDGAGGQTPYKWVKPPWYVGNVNVKPKASTSDITFENGVSPLIGVTSDDAQIILNLPQGALPVEDGATAVRVSFTPLDPKKLAKLPRGMRPDGNAYRVEMSYQPAGGPVRQTATSGNVIMVVPDEAETMLYSVDGKSWDEMPSHQLGDPNTLGSAFNKPGYYLVGTTAGRVPQPQQGKRHEEDGRDGHDRGGRRPAARLRAAHDPAPSRSPRRRGGAGRQEESGRSAAQG